MKNKKTAFWLIMALSIMLVLGSITASAISTILRLRSAIPKENVLYNVAYESSPLEEAGLSYNAEIIKTPDAEMSRLNMGVYSMGIYKTITDTYGFIEGSTTEIVHLIGDNPNNDEVTMFDNTIISLASLNNIIFFPIYKGSVDGADVYKVPLKNGEAFYHIGSDGVCRKFEASLSYKGADGQIYNETYHILVENFGILVPMSEKVFTSASDEEWSSFSKKTRLFSLSALMMNTSGVQLGDPTKSE